MPNLARRIARLERSRPPMTPADMTCWEITLPSELCERLVGVHWDVGELALDELEWLRDELR